MTGESCRLCRSHLTAACRARAMPIRFRCAYCNQLLGIARRKAGTVVRCPTCAGQVVVPPSDVPDPPEMAAAPPPAPTRAPTPAPAPAPAREPPVFERNDFDELLNEAGIEEDG